MKSSIRSRSIAVALYLFPAALLLQAQTPIAPGQIATAPRIAASLPEHAPTVSVTVPKTTIADVETAHDRFINRLWITSIVANIGASTFDAASSWGKQEGDPFLASPGGAFGAKGVALKAGLAGAIIVPQICLRKHRDLKGLFAGANFIEAGVFTGVAVHNLQVH